MDKCFFFVLLQFSREYTTHFMRILRKFHSINQHMAFVNSIMHPCIAFCDFVILFPLSPLFYSLNSYSQTNHQHISLCWALLSREGFSCGSAGQESTCNAGHLDLIPGLGRPPGEGKGYPLQYSGLENSMDCIVLGVAKSQTRLRDFHFHFQGNSGHQK